MAPAASVRGSLLIAASACRLTEAIRSTSHVAVSEDSRNKPDPLSIYATTFNGGNQKYESWYAGKFKTLASVLLEGHEGADIMFMGFQEMKDAEEEFGAYIKSLAWGAKNGSAPAKLFYHKFDSSRYMGGACELNADDPFDDIGGGFGGFDFMGMGKHMKKLGKRAMDAAGMEPHYDTFMYVYTNPSSKWSFEVVPHEAPSNLAVTKCIQEWEGELGRSKPDRGSGCSINNNKNMECGKVVNLMRLKATKKGADDVEKSKMICLLNTHMSYSGKTADRVRYITRAMEETADCDSVVFVGDFNSRLHCGADAPLKKKNSNGQTSFQTIMQAFCKGSVEKCAMGPTTPQEWDELREILTSDEVRCDEGGKTETIKKNTVKTHGFKEPEEAGPQFPFTYKWGKPESDLDADWSSCLVTDKQSACVINKSNKGKHNPAWTDRIIARGFQGSSFYNSRFLSPFFGSDHQPVAAMLHMEA
eukprot:TRINITY_DN11676_c0_g1_i10.p1 TRINITY_DN11676_c0_g1~~TRINITY_DN11676_c0_g1_i10.p1  ORF type:complete len:500 (-),score=105.46 TRINITY_DN11676_c0_g1_i10:91-1512(-)